MDVVVLTGLCVVALAVAALCAVRWGGLRVKPRPMLTTATPLRPREALLRFLRATALATVGGAAAGILVLGFGGRLAMRVLAATSGEHAQGLLTDAEERVGEITLGGTVGLILFVGLAGGFAGGLLYVALRRWLPGPAWLAGLCVGILGLALFARLDPLNPDSVDFQILRPRPLAVALFVVIFPAFGIVLASVVERLDRSYPTLAARPRSLFAHAPILLYLLLGPLVIVLIMAAGVAMVAPRLRPLARAWRTTAVRRGGQVTLGAIALAALTWLGAGIAEIFQA